VAVITVLRYRAACDELFPEELKLRSLKPQVHKGMKKRSDETQTLRAGCTKAAPKISAESLPGLATAKV